MIYQNHKIRKLIPSSSLQISQDLQNLVVKKAAEHSLSNMETVYHPLVNLGYKTQRLGSEPDLHSNTYDPFVYEYSDYKANVYPIKSLIT
jgi:hypothetical protein